MPSEHLIKVAMSGAKYTLHYQSFQVQLSGDGRGMANGNQFGQLCHKPSKAAMRSSTVPVGRRVEDCASVQKQTFSVLPCVLVVETATCR